MIEKLKKIVSCFLIMVLGFGIIYNIINMITINKTYKINYDSEVFKEIKKSKQVIEENKEKIEKMETSKFSDEEISTLQNAVTVMNDFLDDLNIIDKTGSKKLKVKDVYTLEKEIYELPVIYFSSISIIQDNHKVLYSDNNKLNGYNFSSMMWLRNNTLNKLSFNYKDIYIYGVKDPNITNDFLPYLAYYIKLLESQSDWIIEYGGSANA